MKVSMLHRVVHSEYILCCVQSEGAAVDARGHRPLTRGRETYNGNRYTFLRLKGNFRNPFYCRFLFRYRGRPTPAPVGGRQEKKKEEYNEAGGCTHASEAMGVLCPTGCELKNSLQKQERNVKSIIVELRPQIDDLSRSSNNVYNYVNGISSSLRERQLVFNSKAN
ncbi:hypothetical protein XENOCAPTIV_015868, partial [Xenoophorus captivus]